MKFDAAVFDLDGTLVDTLSDIATLMNGVLSDFGFPGHPEDSYREMVGCGMRRLAFLAVPEEKADDHLAGRVAAEMVARYLKAPVAATKPYPGVPQALRTLAAAGVRLAVVSNKPDELVKPILALTLPDVSFSFVSGARDGIPRKPDPALPLMALGAMGIDPSRAAFVGDSSVDVETGKNSRMGTVAVLWGFRARAELEGADVLVATADELVGAILGRTRPGGTVLAQNP